MREIACGGGKGNTGLFIELNAACCCCCTRNPYCSLFNLNQFIFCSVAKYVIIKCDDTSQIMKWYRKKCLEIKNEAKPNTNRRSPLFRNTLSQNNRFRLFRILFFFFFWISFRFSLSSPSHFPVIFLHFPVTFARAKCTQSRPCTSLRVRKCAVPMCCAVRRWTVEAAGVRGFGLVVVVVISMILCDTPNAAPSLVHVVCLLVCNSFVLSISTKFISF